MKVFIKNILENKNDIGVATVRYVHSIILKVLSMTFVNKVGLVSFILDLDDELVFTINVLFSLV